MVTDVCDDKYRNAYGPLLDACPLLEVLSRIRHEWDDNVHLNPGGKADMDYLAFKLGMSVRTLHRMRRRGTVRFWEADRICIGLGLHPVQLWGPEYWMAFEERGTDG